MVRTDAAIAVGVSETTGKRWFLQAGGVVPPYVHAIPTGLRLSIEEREEIALGAARLETIGYIARSIGRAPSTVQRELRRNGIDYRSRAQLDPTPRVGRKRTAPCRYRARAGQLHADQAALRPKLARLATNGLLHDAVQAMLEDKLSPEQIAAILRQEFADEPNMQVSHETIYQSIYVQGRGALRRELAICLRTGRALRRPHRKSGERRGRMPGAVSISERPAEVEDRAVPGHWEGDLILGKNGKSAIGTLVERSTRFVALLHLPNGQSAADVEEAMIAATQQLPQTLLKTLTWDRGTEMTNHAQIRIATGLEIFFCDPHSPWQRGSNENTNGLLRQYFPKGTDLSTHTAEHLQFVSDQLNRRPRKTLGWVNPARAFRQLLSTPSDHGVATTG
jgi:IS30 family transposase